MSREYDIVVFGATGYTGALTAEYIATNLPTDIRWAIAGRSASKLNAIAKKCKELNPNRMQPAVEVCNLDDVELSDLARKTTILCTTVGPYAHYGEHAFAACAMNGTHYLDITGEVAHVHAMIRKYEMAAKITGAIMIPQIGFESAPADLMTYALVTKIRQELSAPTAEAIISLHEVKAMSLSGGSISSIIGLLDKYSVLEVRAAQMPYALSPIPHPEPLIQPSLYKRIFGVRTVKHLGFLSTSIGAIPDQPIVERSWGLLGGPKLYGPRFSFNEYMRTKNMFWGVLTHFLVYILLTLLAFPFFRRFVSKRLPSSGDAPSGDPKKKMRIEYRGIAKPDIKGPLSKKTAFCKTSIENGPYHFTAMLLAEGALCILKDDTVARKLGGGVFTPATLGQPFIDRLDKAGYTFETKMLDG